MVVAAGFTAADDQPPAAARAGEEKWLVDRALTISPRAEPEPALKYRLLPLAKELKEGNAVPIYLRIGHEQYDSIGGQCMETPTKWNELPLDRCRLPMPTSISTAFKPSFSARSITAPGAETAEWNYTLEQPDPISILLPDAQQMRGYAPMLVLRARVQIAERNYSPPPGRSNGLRIRPSCGERARSLSTAWLGWRLSTMLHRSHPGMDRAGRTLPTFTGR